MLSMILILILIGVVRPATFHSHTNKKIRVTMPNVSGIDVKSGGPRPNIPPLLNLNAKWFLFGQIHGC